MCSPQASADACAHAEVQLHIQYKPNEDMVLANHLHCIPSRSNNLPIPLAYNVQHIQFSKAELDIIQGSMECEPVYSTIYHLTFRGWPKYSQETNEQFSL